MDRRTNRHDVIKDSATYKSVVSEDSVGTLSILVILDDEGIISEAHGKCYFEIRKGRKYSSMERQRVEILLSRLAET